MNLKQIFCCHNDEEIDRGFYKNEQEYNEYAPNKRSVLSKYR